MTNTLQITFLTRRFLGGEQGQRQSERGSLDGRERRDTACRQGSRARCQRFCAPLPERRVLAIGGEALQHRR
jgi:hypothetical protein